jgi:hypothetical protein
MPRWMIGALLGLFVAASPVSADLTLTSSTTGKGLGMSGAADGITYIKGAKMRSDVTMRGEDLSTIIDLDEQKFYSINHKKKEVEVWNMADFSAELSKVTDSDITVDMSPTGQTKELLGQTCEEYSMRVAVAFAPGGAGDQINIVMAGPVWVAKDSPGVADYRAFYEAASERGLFFTDPRVVKAQPGQAKGMAELYRRMAEAGVAYATDIQVKMEGSGMLGAMMSKMGGSSMSTNVTRVSTDAVADDLFVVPAGYKVKPQKK